MSRVRGHIIEKTEHYNYATTEVEYVLEFEHPSLVSLAQHLEGVLQSYAYHRDIENIQFSPFAVDTRTGQIMMWTMTFVYLSRDTNFHHVPMEVLESND